MKTYAFRLKSGRDLRFEINKFVKSKDIKAGVILTCVGNLSKAILRMPGGKIIRKYVGSFEIVSLVGTVESGDEHLHILLSDEKGKVFGGHLKYGSIIGVTAEIVIGEIENMQFLRRLDKKTGYHELVVKEDK